MLQKGTHTWDLNLSYHRCPACGFIFESREGCRYRMGLYQKELECERCGHQYTFSKQKQPRFGPLLGEPQPVEVDWNSEKKR